MHYAAQHGKEGAIFLLNQEKAYDRVRHIHLKEMLVALNFPMPWIAGFLNLFGSTAVQANVNGHLTSPFTQRRGLRQGDPLSPLLFNIALEPLIRRLQKAPRLNGFQSPVAPPPLTLPLRVIAYADDVAPAFNDYSTLYH